MSIISQSSDRFSFRVEPQKKRAIEQAAALRGQSLTDFAVLTLYREAQDVLRNDRVVVLSDKQRDAFLKALDNPKPPTAKAIRAAKRFKTARSKGAIA